MTEIFKDFLLSADLQGREKMKNAILSECKDVKIQSIGRSILGRDIDCFSFGRGKRRILLVGAHHALESITANLLYAFTYSMCSGKAELTSLFASYPRAMLLHSFTYFVIPCLNPDGIELRRHGAEDTPLRARLERMSGGDFSSWQANARGVDLNHNYNACFYEYKHIEKELDIKPGATLYSGDYPESEPEVRCMANFVRTVCPSGIISLHTQGGEVFFSPKNDRTRRIAGRIAARSGYVPMMPEGTAMYGGLCDFTGALGIPSFTVEVGKGVNPLPEEMLPSIIPRVLLMLVEFPTYL